MLVVGDSTGVGTGATSAQNSLAGLIGQAQPRWLIENRSQDGAKFADVIDQLGGEQHFDIVLVQAGGNDVIRLRGIEAMRADIDQVADLARRRGKMVIWMPAGNVGNAPFFYPPVSWWMTQRSRAMHGAVQDAAARTGAIYVNLFYERNDDPFVIDRSLNAKDGLHPSDAGYRLWWQALKAHAEVASVVSGDGQPLARDLPVETLALGHRARVVAPHIEPEVRLLKLGQAMQAQPGIEPAVDRVAVERATRDRAPPVAGEHASTGRQGLQRFRGQAHRVRRRRESSPAR